MGVYVTRFLTGHNSLGEGEGRPCRRPFASRVRLAGARYLKLITPNSPVKLLSGPAVKKS